MKNVKKDFVLLQQTVKGLPLCYLDNAATSQKPQQVVQAMVNFYNRSNANVYRGVHSLGEQVTTLYGQARSRVASFIGADSAETVFTAGTTASINCVATSWGLTYLKKGDEIVLTELEHHANLLPWQHVAQKTGAILKFIPVTANGSLDYAAIPDLITTKTKLVAITQSSNAIGTPVDIATIVPYVRQVGAKLLVDAAQSVPHQSINVHKLDCDFLAFSGHKMLGPTGIGVLYIKKELHDAMPPYQFGGGMVYHAEFDHATWLRAPHKFEAGTPAIAQAIGLKAAIDYLDQHVDFAQLQTYEARLCSRLIDGLSRFKQVRIVGPEEELKKRGHLVSFVVDGMHAHDVATYLDRKGICVRAGHHCAQPLATKLGIAASVRASFYLYNTIDEVDRLVEAIDQLIKEL